MFVSLIPLPKQKFIRLKQTANSDTWSTTHDIDALITVEVLLVTPEVADGERLQIANIQFNNLDIIGKKGVVLINNYGRLNHA